MKIVEQYGTLWRVSERSYKKLLRLIADGEGYNLDAIGKRVGQLNLSPLDMPAKEARYMLDEMAGIVREQDPDDEDDDDDEG